MGDQWAGSTAPTAPHCRPQYQVQCTMGGCLGPPPLPPSSKKRPTGAAHAPSISQPACERPAKKKESEVNNSITYVLHHMHHLFDHTSWRRTLLRSAAFSRSSRPQPKLSTLKPSTPRFDDSPLLTQPGATNPAAFRPSSTYTAPATASLAPLLTLGLCVVYWPILLWSSAFVLPVHFSCARPLSLSFGE